MDLHGTEYSTIPPGGIDTLAIARFLKDKGIEDEQAEAHAEILGQIVDNNLATKKDIEELRLATKHDIEKLRSDTKRDIADVNNNIERIRAELKRDITDVNKNIEQLKSDTKRDIAKLRTDLTLDIEKAKNELLKWVIGLSITHMTLTVVLIGAVIFKLFTIG